MQFPFISFHKRKLDQHLGDVKANVLGLLVISPEPRPRLRLNYCITHTTSTSHYAVCHVHSDELPPGGDLRGGCERR